MADWEREDFDSMTIDEINQAITNIQAKGGKATLKEMFRMKALKATLARLNGINFQ